MSSALQCVDILHLQVNF